MFFYFVAEFFYFFLIEPPKSLVTVGATSNIDTENLDEINLNSSNEESNSAATIDTNANPLLEQVPPNSDSILSQAASSFSALPSVASSVLSTFSKRIYSGANTREQTPEQDPNCNFNPQPFQTATQSIPTAYATDSNQLLGNTNSGVDSLQSAGVSYYQTPESLAPIEPPKFYSPSELPSISSAAPPTTAAGQNTFRLTAKKKIYAPIPGLEQQAPPTVNPLPLNAPIIPNPSVDYSQSNYNYEQSQAVPAQQEKKSGLFSLTNLVPTGVLQNISGLVQSAAGTLAQSVRPEATVNNSVHQHHSDPYYQSAGLSEPTNYFGVNQVVPTPPTVQHTLAGQTTEDFFTTPQSSGVPQVFNQPAAQPQFFNPLAAVENIPSSSHSEAQVAVAQSPLPGFVNQAVSNTPPSNSATHIVGPSASDFFNSSQNIPPAGNLQQSQPQSILPPTVGNFFKPNSESVTAQSPPIAGFVPQGLANRPSSSSSANCVSSTTNFFNPTANVLNRPPSAHTDTVENQYFQSPPAEVPKTESITFLNPANFTAPIPLNPVSTSTHPTVALSTFFNPVVPQTVSAIPTECPSAVPILSSVVPITTLPNQGSAVSSFRLQKGTRHYKSPFGNDELIAPTSKDFNVFASLTSANNQTTEVPNYFVPQSNETTQNVEIIATSTENQVAQSSNSSLVTTVPNYFLPQSSESESVALFAAPLEEESTAFNTEHLKSEESKQSSEFSQEPQLPDSSLFLPQSSVLEISVLEEQQQSSDLLVESKERTSTFTSLLDQSSKAKPSTADFFSPTNTAEEQSNLFVPATTTDQSIEHTNQQKETEVSESSDKIDLSLQNLSLETEKPSTFSNFLPPPPINNSISNQGNPYRKDIPTSAPTAAVPILSNFFQPSTSEATDFNFFNSTVVPEPTAPAESYFSQPTASIPSLPESAHQINPIALSQENTSQFPEVVQTVASPIPPPLGFDNIVKENPTGVSQNQSTTATPFSNYFNQNSNQPIDLSKLSNTTSFFDNIAVPNYQTTLPQQQQPAVATEDLRIQNFFNNPPPQENVTGVGDIQYDLVHRGLPDKLLDSSSQASVSNLVEPPSSSCSEWSELNNSRKLGNQLAADQVVEKKLDSQDSASISSDFDSITTRHYSDLPEEVLKTLRMAHQAATEKPTTSAAAAVSCLIFLISDFSTFILNLLKV